MKVIGLLGGMSWESSAEYYRIVNERVRERAGGLHSVDFAEIERLQVSGDWDEAGGRLAEAAAALAMAGADFIVLCTNTMHKVADDVLVPPEDDRAEVHRIIYEELVVGVVRDDSRDTYRSVMQRLVDRGAEGVIELLVGQDDSPVPVFPTTRLHAELAADHALGLRRSQGLLRVEPDAASGKPT